MHTRRGPVETPAFMAVGTHAHVRNLSVEDVLEADAPVMLGNTYHLMLRPGIEVFKHFGGIHRYIDWHRPILTDSGGFQIFSLEGERKIFERGAHFRSYLDNSRHILSPERSIEVQQAIGSDIMMVLDVCVPSTSDEPTTLDAMKRTHRWALRSLAQRNKGDLTQALFAIVQGGVFESLRRESAGFLTQHPFDGFAIGGLAVGETKDELEGMTELVTPLLPQDKPRYLMGVGTPRDLVEAVRRGVDMFDCIIPNKMGQQGYAYTFTGQIRLQRMEFEFKDEPIDPTCDCRVCQRYSRGYLHHLMRGKHQLGWRMLGLHNLRHYQRLMRKMRDAIRGGAFPQLYAELRETL